MQAVARSLFYGLSNSRALKHFASRYGMASPDSFARRFIAGESVEEAIATCRALAARGLHITLDHLGESVISTDAARAATDTYVRLLDALLVAGVERNVSLKLTQLGIDIDRDLCIEHLRRVVEPARHHGFFVRIDMEDSRYTDATLQIVEGLWQDGYRNLGVVLQAALRRSARDVDRMVGLGIGVRLVKGAYMEPAEVAFQEKAEVDASYVRLMRHLLDHGNYPAIATHDEVILRQAREYAHAGRIAPDRFEFQMLYGIRRDLQSTLIAGGYRVRVYVPFGREWFPYFMRRLGERPANVAFVLRSLLHEGLTGRRGAADMRP